MAFKDGKINRRDLLKQLGAGALLTSPLLAAPERADAFFNALMLKKKAQGTPVDPVNNIFSSYIYTGNGGTQTFVTGTDFATNGGLIWIKRRDSAISHALFDSARGAANLLVTDTTAAEVGGYPITMNSNGFTITSSTSTNINANGGTYVAWCFRKAAKFFDLGTVTKSAGSNATIDFAALGALGMVLVKRTDSTGAWYAWHRGLDAGNLVTFGDNSESAMTHISVSGTTVTLTNGVIADGNYIVYAWAHDSASNGNIYFGSLANAQLAATITIGWEPQALYYKANGYSHWGMFDVVRGDTSGSQKILVLNTSAAEVSYSNQPYPLATGISWQGGAGPNKLLYMAIRKP